MARRGEAVERIVALVRRAVDPSDGLTAADAVLALDPDDVTSVLHAHFAAGVEPEVIATGLPASPGAATGVLVLSAEEALEVSAAGDPVVLVRLETSADDVVGMQCAQGIVTARGGVASHAAVVARGLGIPAVVGAGAIRVLDGAITAGGRTVAAGEWLSIDGGTGEVFVGAAEVARHESVSELHTLLGWADQLAQHRVVVRANADTAADAAHARSLGAQGIGLCRTEHMFFAPERLALLRRFLLAEDETTEDEALAGLEDVQRDDFEAILAVMDGLHVSIRLLDAPLHEFLPAREAPGGPSRTDLHEVNPMMGTRGIRLGVIRPALYRMQVRAICRAAQSRLDDGGSPRVEILVPMVMDPSETALARSWVADAVAATDAAAVLRDLVHVGAMIETPRAALLASEIAANTDAISFGTNDLTQLVFGLSRDDTDGPMLSQYLAQHLLPSNPFATLDVRGVGRLVGLACDDARAARSELSITVCGEHAGDPVSIDHLVRCGVDVVSCSPYRVPVARLAVAQALLRRGQAAVLPAGPGAPRPPDQTAATVPDDEATGALVLHALRIKGFTTVAHITELVGVDGGPALRALEALAAAEQARFVEKRSLWQITASGRQRHDQLLPGLDDQTLARLQRPYAEFLALNTRFKQLCTEWQVRDGVPNDHADAAYDASCIRRLGEIHDDVRPVLTGFATALARFSLYAARLSGAWQGVAAGDLERFTGVMRGSYHDVWMEMHQDLILILGVDRTREGSH